MSRLIPKYYEYDLGGRTRMGTSVALANSDRMLIARGLIDGAYPVNKFGNTSNADSDTITDVWDAVAQPVWLAPTAPRIHTLLSDDDEDSGLSSPLGIGAHTIRIWGLQTWDTAETSEDIIMNGTGGVNTANAYVIIHRMQVLTNGGAPVPNVGLITAVAAVDGTLTAQIRPIRGQTFMCIFGVPSTQIFYINMFQASLARASPVGATAGVILFSTMDVENNPATFIFKHTAALNEDATASFVRPFNPPKKFEGPCIVKMAMTAADNDTFGDASFDGVLIDN
jgi:hypothetical protein